MIESMENAHGALADALWWLKGFAAGQEDGSEARAMSDRLREVRVYLDRIMDGRVRRIGEERAIVLTFAEFERLIDVLTDPGCLASRGHAREVKDRVLGEYQIEAAKARVNPEIPF